MNGHPARFLGRCILIWLYAVLFLWVAMESEDSPMWVRVVAIALLAWSTFCILVALINWRRHRPSRNGEQN
jgi:hypothetical protein